ncbi:1-acyl-sn-glycerol-3-phosphate acyltransferase [Spirosomataceae bacterium TFI 002]|nr:1-acyl-sn-glycerol-3-phosphate acyltransferase [Spirosomataceae bacterium TFI 002]
MTELSNYFMSLECELESLEAFDFIQKEIYFDAGETVVSQLERAKFLYFLIEGEVSLSIKLKDEPENLKVGLSSSKFTPIGWSGFKEPYRYATSTTAVTNIKLISIEFENLALTFEKYPNLGTLFLKFVVSKSSILLYETRKMLAQLVPVSQQSFLQLNPFDSIDDNHNPDLDEGLKRSPFFEVFNEDELDFFKSLGILTQVKTGEKYFRQEENADQISFLISGRLALIHAEDKLNQKLDKRIVNNEGYIITIDAFTESETYFDTCVALQSTWVWSINSAKLRANLLQSPALAIKFYKRLLWYTSVSLRSARARLIRVQYDGEISAVKHIIEQHASQLDVLSKIHKIPTLLNHTITINDAFVSLEKLKVNGTSLEKRLANSSLSILSEVLRENDFYNGLAKIYSSIVNAPEVFFPNEVRSLCAESFYSLFEKTGYNLKGIENLPEEPAIYIYNHLENHPYNTLPNSFQLTLDSHFISSVILFKKFQNPGIRVVRVPKGEEYGHQLYYERLGHIPVYTQDSQQLNETDQEKKNRRNEFYITAEEYLNNGTSILLAPEGRSYTTDQSPGEFKAGAFILASKLPKEPLIVPIAVANFDKRLNRTQFSAVIKEPFRLSDRIENVNDREEMNTFLSDLRNSFQNYVKEAQELTNESSWTKML